jgi:hypothetical protein
MKKYQLKKKLIFAFRFRVSFFDVLFIVFLNSVAVPMAEQQSVHQNISVQKLKALSS